MSEAIQQDDILDFDKEEQKLPDGLNILTILTFVGCGIGFLFSIVGYTRAPKSYQDLVAAQDKLDNLSGTFKALVGPDPVEAARRNMEYRLPIFLMGLVGYILCVYGAIQMRKWKKSGYYTYVAGEVLPIVGYFSFVGIGLASSISLGFTLAIPAIFIILYSLQLKNLK